MTGRTTFFDPVSNTEFEHTCNLTEVGDIHKYCVRWLVNSKVKQTLNSWNKEHSCLGVKIS